VAPTGSIPKCELEFGAPVGAGADPPAVVVGPGWVVVDGAAVVGGAEAASVATVALAVSAGLAVPPPPEHAATDPSAVAAAMAASHRPRPARPRRTARDATGRRRGALGGQPARKPEVVQMRWLR
jgi:hypothetical protein